ncbi:hypothetical protein FB451DRAFT_1359213 [Mycena latifolia]|nr:hypothetical protein FB451DRAFT_1359213 [Mycena latifolia]
MAHTEEYTGSYIDARDRDLGDDGDDPAMDFNGKWEYSNWHETFRTSKSRNTPNDPEKILVQQNTTKPHVEVKTELRPEFDNRKIVLDRSYAALGFETHTSGSILDFCFHSPPPIKQEDTKTVTSIIPPLYDVRASLGQGCPDKEGKCLSSYNYSYQRRNFFNSDRKNSIDHCSRLTVRFLLGINISPCNAEKNIISSNHYIGSSCSAERNCTPTSDFLSPLEPGLSVGAQLEIEVQNGTGTGTDGKCT